MTFERAQFVSVDRHQFYVIDTGLRPLEVVGDPAMVEPLPGGGAVVFTGIATGSVRYDTRAHPARPDAQLSGWDATHEIRLAVRRGLHVEGFGAATFDDTELALNGPGDYILRVSVCDRGDDSVTTDEHSAEHYFIETWPETAA